MTVYVDDAKNPYGRMIMCHMLADDVEELHNMATSIGVARRHFQNKTKFLHYDICKQMRSRAVNLGAEEVTTKEMVMRFK